MLKRFQQGDKVQYTGKKFASDLQGKLGEVAGRVENQETGVVVDFGGESYIMDENKHLAPFQGHLKSGPSREDKKDTKVERRRPKRQQQRNSEDEG